MKRILFIAAMSALMYSFDWNTAAAQEDLSDFGAAFQVFQQSTEALRRFDVSAEDVVIPLSETYRIGPGDIIQIILTGMINDVLPVQVGPQGDIFVPPAGLLDVDGMTIAESRDYIDTELSAFLINYKLDVQLIRARKISVYLLGQIRQPGTYITLAGTTAISLVQTSGSLVTAPVTINFNEPAVVHPYFRALTSGAGRRIEVWRNNEKIGTVDMADVAISGKIGSDIILEDGDAIYIPANRRPVVVRGGVSRPGTYEVRDNDTVLDLMAQAGGIRSMMLLEPVQVERRNPAGSETPTSLITLDLTNPDFNPREFRFQSGDTLRVPEVKDRVFVLGAVWGPQAVDFHEGWTALDYIAETGGPVAPTDISYIQIISFPLTDRQSSMTFSLKNLTKGEMIESVPIEPGDLIWVPWDNQPFYGPGLTNTLATFLGQTVSLLRIIEGLP